MVPEAGDGDSAPRAETLNSMKALWARSRDEVSDDEYHELYKHISHDWREPLETIRLQAEGAFELAQALLFVPAHAPHDLFTRDFKRGIQLYVKRVFIMDDCEALLPPYLRFVKGVVDAADLSLNVSREILQQDRHIRMMQRRLTKKVLATVKEFMTKDADRYATFWREFGTVLKEGLVTDSENRDAILAVSSFATTHAEDEPTTLARYVERMKDGQDDIYYLTGDSRQSIENSPHMEAFRDKGIEVLLLTDAVDEVWVDAVGEYEGKRLRSVAKGEIDLDAQGDEEADEEREKQAEDYAGLLGWMREQLGEDIKEVRLSARLTVSPACVVSDAHDPTPALENMYRAMGQEVPRAQRILELNPGHPLVKGLNQAYNEREDRSGLVESAELLHTLAVLAEGGQPKDPARFVKLVADRLERTLSSGDGSGVVRGARRRLRAPGGVMPVPPGGMISPWTTCGAVPDPASSSFAARASALRMRADLPAERASSGSFLAPITAMTTMRMIASSLSPNMVSCPFPPGPGTARAYRAGSTASSPPRIAGPAARAGGAAWRGRAAPAARPAGRAPHARPSVRRAAPGPCAAARPGRGGRSRPPRVPGSSRPRGAIRATAPGRRSPGADRRAAAAPRRTWPPRAA
ncbi:Chaperone protein HtpG [Streptomyces purpurascens]